MLSGDVPDAAREQADAVFTKPTDITQLLTWARRVCPNGECGTPAAPA
jgi:hypothetical protein